MKSISLLLVVILACGVGGWSIYRQFQTSPVTVKLAAEFEHSVYVCTETGDIVEGEWVPTPAINTKTGRKSLVQALFCEKCQLWYPAPPPEMAERSPRGPTCPIDKTPLVVDGPVSAPSSITASHQIKE